MAKARETSELREHIEALHADADALRRDERALNGFLARYESQYQRPPLTRPRHGERVAP